MTSWSFAPKRSVPAAIAAILTFSIKTQAGFICLNFDQLDEFSDSYGRERIETYLKSHYPLTTVQIRRIEGRYFIALSASENRGPRYYHLVELGESNVTEPFVFEGSGLIITWDSPFGHDKYLGNDYTFYYFGQPEKSYLFVGFPRLNGPLLVRELSTESAKHMPRC